MSGPVGPIVGECKVIGSCTDLTPSLRTPTGTMVLLSGLDSRKLNVERSNQIQLFRLSVSDFIDFLDPIDDYERPGRLLPLLLLRPRSELRVLAPPCYIFCIFYIEKFSTPFFKFARPVLFFPPRCKLQLLLLLP